MLAAASSTKSAMTSLLAFIFTLLAISANNLHLVSAEEAVENKNNMIGVFVNDHPKDEITLYWVDPEFSEDDPKRLVSIALAKRALDYAFTYITDLNLTSTMIKM